MVTPIRTCLGCRQRAPKSELVRLAWAAGQVVIDERQVLPGRGGYLHLGCTDAVIKRRAVGHALRQAVDAAQVASLLTRPAD